MTSARRCAIQLDVLIRALHPIALVAAQRALHAERAEGGTRAETANRNLLVLRVVLPMLHLNSWRRAGIVGAAVFSTWPISAAMSPKPSLLAEVQAN